MVVTYVKFAVVCKVASGIFFCNKFPVAILETCDSGITPFCAIKSSFTHTKDSQ
jgi:hypothetical protein